MIHELRIYRCLPGKLADVLGRFSDTVLALFERHGFRPIQFWTVAVGRGDHLLYMLEWDSEEDRDAAWACFLSDPEWLGALERTDVHGPLVTSVGSQTLLPIGLLNARACEIPRRAPRRSRRRQPAETWLNDDLPEDPYIPA